MDLRPGYKQTDIGVIPEDWGVYKLRELCRLINGRGFKPHEWKSVGYPIIRIQNLNGSEDFNHFSGPFDPKIIVEPGQLLFAWSGSRGTSFGPHIWRGETGVLNYHTWKVMVDRKKVDEDFFFYALRHLTEFIEDNAHGASALVHTQKWEMEGFDLAIPQSKEEQSAIAAALMDLDASIDTISRLVRKKSELRTGVIQRLLTAEIRLPGFTTPWQTKRLGDLGVFLKGAGVKRDDALSGHLPCVRYGEIYTTHHNVIRQFSSYISRSVADGAKRVQVGDLLFAGSGETKAEIGKCVALAQDVEAYAGGDIIILRPNTGNPVFLGWLMNTPQVARQKANFGQGDAVVHISASALASIEVSLPDLDEQDAIAQVITDMDAEITALEARLEKTRALKQGMMQALLTGRVRLPVQSEPLDQLEVAHA